MALAAVRLCSTHPRHPPRKPSLTLPPCLLSFGASPGRPCPACLPASWPTNLPGMPCPLAEWPGARAAGRYCCSHAVLHSPPPRAVALVAWADALPFLLTCLSACPGTFAGDRAQRSHAAGAGAGAGARRASEALDPSSVPLDPEAVSHMVLPGAVASSRYGGAMRRLRRCRCTCHCHSHHCNWPRHCAEPGRAGCWLHTTPPPLTPTPAATPAGTVWMDVCISAHPA